jgi:ABC-2 type transport system permease protein
MRQLLTLTVSDLRQRIRDTSVLVFALVVPLALMFVFNLVFGATDDLSSTPSPWPSPHPPVTRWPRSSRTSVRFRGLDGLDGLTVTRGPAGRGGRSAVDDGDAGARAGVPEGFGGSRGRRGAPVTSRSPRATSTGSRPTSSSRSSTVLDQFARRPVAAAARAAAAEGGRPTSSRRSPRRRRRGPDVYELVPGEAAERAARRWPPLVAGQAGLFLLFTVSFGVLGLLAERENGTLARLRSMPMPPAGTSSPPRHW